MQTIGPGRLFEDSAVGRVIEIERVSWESRVPLWGALMGSPAR